MATKKTPYEAPTPASDKKKALQTALSQLDKVVLPEEIKNFQPHSTETQSIKNHNPNFKRSEDITMAKENKSPVSKKVEDIKPEDKRKALETALTQIKKQFGEGG